MASSSWINLAVILAILISAALQSNAYSFKCLDECDCDTEDSAVHCHNGDRERLQLPKSKLRGFEVIGLTRNQITVLPSQDLLLEKFPDLKAVDVEGNAEFDCSTLDQYTKITVMSDCGKTAEELEKQREKLPATVGTADGDCDARCQADKRARALHEYIIRLWEMIKQKLQEVSQQTGMDKFFEDVQKFVNDDVGGFFTDVGNKISNFKF